MTGNDRNKIVAKLFSSLFTKYQMGFETSVKGSDFVLDSIDGLH